MAHTTIKRILNERIHDKLIITTIEDAEGNEATGIGRYAVGTPIITYMDDRYNKVKFEPVIGPRTPKYGPHRTPNTAT